jgi:rhamnulokinase
VLAQARAFGTVDPDRYGVRRLVRTTQDLRRYEPRGDSATWDAAEARIRPAR